MKIGFLFPGQGSQTIGMGKDLYDEYEEYRNVYSRVNKILNTNLEDITFYGSEEDLNQTKNTQISILTMSLAILELLKKEGIEAEASMGLSLGEYSALMYNNVFSFEDGIKIVKKRGELMQNLCPNGDWSMAALLGLDEEKVTEICNNINSGFVSAANYNCPGQIVISGEKSAVNEAIEQAKVAGAKKAIELKTSGPFHTIKLEEASKELRKELDNIEINNVKSKVIKNIDGKEYSENDSIKDVLAAHIINPVRFEDSIKNMLDMGVDTFIEVGPGKALSGFVKRTDKTVNILNINNVESFNNTVKFIKEN